MSSVDVKWQPVCKRFFVDCLSHLFLEEAFVRYEVEGGCDVCELAIQLVLKIQTHTYINSLAKMGREVGSKRRGEERRDRIPRTSSVK